MKHTWMTSNDINDIDILETVRENFNPRRTLKSAVSAVRAMNRLKVAAASDKKTAASAFSKALENAKLKGLQKDNAAEKPVAVATDKPAVAAL